MGERDMFRRGSVSPVWPPMSRYDQQIYPFFRPTYHFKQLLGSFIPQRNRNVINSWLIFCCFPTWLIISKGNQSESDAFDFPYCRFQRVTERRTFAAVVNTGNIQIVHCVG